MRTWRESGEPGVGGKGRQEFPGEACMESASRRQRLLLNVRKGDPAGSKAIRLVRKKGAGRRCTGPHEQKPGGTGKKEGTPTETAAHLTSSSKRKQNVSAIRVQGRPVEGAARQHVRKRTIAWERRTH